MVFYFTGTGNSLYIAKQIEENPVSIPQAIHREGQTYSADSIGIVAGISKMPADAWQHLIYGEDG